MTDENDALNDITLGDFQSWKHHPVTKVFIRFLLDYERQVAEKQIALMRSVDKTPDAFALGMFNGQINSVSMMAQLEFVDLVEFYPDPEEEEQ